MAHLVIQKMHAQPGAEVLAAHRAFVAGHAGELIAHGPISPEPGGAQDTGHVYFTTHETPDAAARFATLDPLAALSSGTVHNWKSRLGRTQAQIAPRPGRTGYFMWALSAPDGAARREALLAAHSAYFRRFDPDHFVARGPLLAADNSTWAGTSVAIEVEDRAAFYAYLDNEPFYSNRLYRQVEIYRWQRGA